MKITLSGAARLIFITFGGPQGHGLPVEDAAKKNSKEQPSRNREDSGAEAPRGLKPALQAGCGFITFCGPLGPWILPVGRGSVKRNGTLNVRGTNEKLMLSRARQQADFGEALQIALSRSRLGYGI